MLLFDRIMEISALYLGRKVLQDFYSASSLKEHIFVLSEDATNIMLMTFPC